VSETETGLWGFLKERKKFWLLPLILVLVLFGVLVLLSVGSEGNFVYTLN
jgi:competence protein ComGC